MRHAVLFSFTLGFFGYLNSAVHAFCFPPGPPTCCMTYEVRPVTWYRAQWSEEKVPIVVQKINYRKEVVPVRTRLWVPKEFDEQVRCSYYVPVPREVERDIWRCVLTATVAVDPWTCCPCVNYYPQWVNQRVRCVEYDYRREERNQAIKVWKWVQEDTVVDQVRWIPEVTQERTWIVQRRCVMVPYQTVTCVPVYCWQ